MSVELGSAYGKIIIDASEAMAGVNRATQSVKSIDESLGKVGKSLTKSITLPLVGLGAAAAKVGSDFESEMKVMAIAARSSGTAIETLSDAAIQMGADTELVGINASEAAGAMTSFYKAGLDTTDMFGDLNGYLAGNASLSGALRAAVDLASASELDLAQSSDVVAVAMATFGLKAEDATRITNSFVQAADASVTDVGQLAEAMVNVGPTAAAFGWSLEQTNTALAILSERGIAGAEAGTALKSMMVNMMRPTDDVTETLDALGVELYDLDGAMRPLPAILGDLEQGLSGTTEEQRNLAVQTLAGSYGMKAMNTLLAEGSSGWQAMEGAIAGAATAQEVAQARTDTFAGAMEQLQGSVETLLIQVGVPLINDFLRPGVEWFTRAAGAISDGLTPGATKLIITLGGLAAATGPLLIGLSKVVQAVNVLKTAMATLGVTGAFSQLAGNFGAAFSLIKGGSPVVATLNQALTLTGSAAANAALQVGVLAGAAYAGAKGGEALANALGPVLYGQEQWEPKKWTDAFDTVRSGAASVYGLGAALSAGVLDVVGFNAQADELRSKAAGVSFAIAGWETSTEQLVRQAKEAHAAALAEGRSLESLNPELAASRRYTTELAIEKQRAAETAVAAAQRQRIAVSSVAAMEEEFHDKFVDLQYERVRVAREAAAEQERIAAEAGVVYNDLAADLAGPLGQMEQELENHQAAMESLEAGHAERMAALSPAGLKVEAERAANAQVAAERQRILDELAGLETSHQEKVQVYEAQGKATSIANENAAYAVKRGNLETALAGLDGQYDTFYANHLTRLQANNAEETALEAQRYADEKARLEASHAEQIALLQQQVAERLQIRTQELLLTGQISEQQANDMTVALAKQFGVSIDETDLAINHILGQYADWASGGQTTADDIAASIGSIDTKMGELEASEEARVQALIDASDRRARTYNSEITDFEGMVAAMEGSAGRLGDVKRNFEELNTAIGNLPAEKTITVRARYQADPELVPQSPTLAIQHMIERAVKFATDNPIQVKGVYAGPTGDALTRQVRSLYEGLAGDLSRPLGQLEGELEDYRTALAEMETEHAAKLAELGEADPATEARRRANEELAASKKKLLDQLADLEAKHQEKVQVYQAQGKESSIESENAAYQVKRGNLEASLAGLAGAYRGYYDRHLGELQAANAEALALEEQRYADEQARAEAAHAERVAAAKRELAERLQARTQEMLLMGQIGQEQADQMTAALMRQLGLGVDETDLAVNRILGLYQDWATGGATAANDVALAIGHVDGLMAIWETDEARRLGRLAELYGDEMGGIVDILGQARVALDSLPEEKRLAVLAQYFSDPELEPQSPTLAIQHMLERAVSFAAANPIQVMGAFEGGLLPPEMPPLAAMIPPPVLPAPAAGLSVADRGLLGQVMGRLSSPQGQSVTIYGGLTLQGVQDAPGLLRQLQALSV